MPPSPGKATWPKGRLPWLWKASRELSEPPRPARNYLFDIVTWLMFAPAEQKEPRRKIFGCVHATTEPMFNAADSETPQPFTAAAACSLREVPRK